MKIIKIIFVSFFILVLVVSAAAVIFIKTLDINRFKPQILSEATKALNRQVDFEKADLAISLSKGVNLKISNLVIADDPAFQKENFLTVKDVSLTVDILKYLFKKEVNVPSIAVDYPRVTIIRKKDGSLNVAAIAQSSQGGKESTKPQEPLEPFSLPAMLISSIKGSNGIITFIDQTFEPPVHFEVSDFNFLLKDISLIEAFPFLIEGAVLSDQKNIRLEGKARINLTTNEVKISGLKGVTDLSDIVMEKIPPAFPMVKSDSLPTVVKGKIDIVVNSLTAGAKGLIALASDVSLSNGFAQLKEIVSPLKDIKMEMNVSDKKIILDKVFFSIGRGSINLSGTIDDYLAKQEYDFAGDIKNLAVQELIVQDTSAVKAEGLVSTSIKLKGQGFSPEALKSTLSGNALVSVTQAKLKDINVLRTVLDKISMVPGLAQKVEAGLPESYKQKLTAKDTALSDIRLPVVIENGRLLVKDAALGADDFIFNGRVEAGFDSTYSLEGLFLIPKELSASMAAQVSELQYLFNNDKQISLPLKISGKAGSPVFSVDAAYIAKKLLASQAKEQLFNALDKAIGAKEEAPPVTEPAVPASKENLPESGMNGATKQGDALDSILERILKK